MHMRVGALGVVSAVIGAGLLLSLGGCPGDTELAKGDDPSQGGGSSGTGGGDAGSGGDDHAAGSGASGASGSSSGGTAGSHGGDSGSGGSGSAGSSGGDSGSGGSGMAGSGGGDACPPNLAIPLICRSCPDGSCGVPTCKNGVFSSFECPGGGGGAGSGGGGDAGGCVHAGCSGELCVESSVASMIASDCVFRAEYACYQAAECARQSDGECGFTPSPELDQCLADAGGGGGGLKWYATCGDPVCSSSETDDPSVPNCTDAMTEGEPCDKAGDRCETLSCGGELVCTDTNPVGIVGCPISRARYKQDISYVDEQQLERLHDEVTHLPLATWEYKQSPGKPQLGFIIEDIEPSAAVEGDHVNVYGYLSMAVAAIQVQQRQIEALQAELEALREGGDASARMCGP